MSSCRHLCSSFSGNNSAAVRRRPAWRQTVKKHAPRLAWRHVASACVGMKCGALCASSIKSRRRGDSRGGICAGSGSARKQWLALLLSC
jgi:hypothetical protein